MKKSYDFISTDILYDLIEKLYEQNRSLKPRTLNDYLRELNSFLEYSDIDEGEISIKECDQYITHLSQNSKIALSTLEKRFSHLSRVLSALVEMGTIDSNPMFVLNKPRRERIVSTKHVMSYSDFDKLVGHFNQLPLKDQGWFYVKFYSLQKINRVLSLRLKDFVFDESTVYLIINEELSLKLPSHVRDVLLELMVEQNICTQTDYMFPGQQEGTHLSSVTAWRTLKNACKITKTSRIYSPKDLRHTGAVMLKDAGTSTEMIDKLLEYRDARSIKGYERAFKSKSIDIENLVNIKLKEKENE